MKENVFLFQVPATLQVKSEEPKESLQGHWISHANTQRDSKPDAFNTWGTKGPHMWPSGSWHAPAPFGVLLPQYMPLQKKGELKL